MMIDQKFLRLSLAFTMVILMGGGGQAQTASSQPKEMGWTDHLLNWVKGRPPSVRPRTQGTLLLTFEPPASGLPGNREGGASRTACLSPRQYSSVANKTVVAIIPQTLLGLTVAARPSFLILVPPTKEPSEGDFELLLDNQVIYQTTTPLSGQEGFLRFTLPADGPELQVGQDYQWAFNVRCDSDSLGRATGWVQRVASSGDLITQLQVGPRSEHPYLYAQAGLWYETLAGLADLRTSDPSNANLESDWKALLASVGLGDLAEAPLLPQPSR